MKRILLILLFVSVSLILLQPCAVAGDDHIVMNASGNQNIIPSVNPIGKTEGYSVILYDSRNGLPTSDANAIAQTRDGFIWIGSYAGLIRYDGNTFEHMYASTKIANVRCLYVDSLDRLWIGSNDAGIFLMEKGALRHWNKDDGLESLSIRIVIEDESGLIYIAGSLGMATIDEELHLHVLTDERITGETIQDIWRGDGNLIYGLTRAGDIFMMEEGRIVTWLSHDEYRIQGVTAILPDPGEPDKLYLGTETGQIYHGSFAQNFSIVNVMDIAPLSYVEHLEWIGDQVWILAENGIGSLDSDGFRLLENVPMKESVEHVMTDSEGNLWFTSGKQGVMKIVPNRFTDLFAQYNLPEKNVNSTCMADGQLFIGTTEGLIVAENNRNVDSIPLMRAATATGTELDTTDLLDYLEGMNIRSIIRDSMNRIWISTWRSYGLVLYDHGEMTVFTPEDGLFSNWVRTVLECENGDILVANSGGVNVIRDNQIVSGYGEEDGISASGILTIVEAQNHDLIFGSDGGGIYIVSSDGIRQIGLDDGLNSEVILRIRRCDSQDLYWIVTSNSLAVMTPDYQVRTIKHFPYPNNYDIYENSRGDVWILSSNGIYIISAEELLNDEESMEPAFFSVFSGLPYTASVNSTSELTDDGTLYIAGDSGIIKVNIDTYYEQEGKIQLALPYIDADGIRYYPDEEGVFTVPAITGRLTIYPYVISYTLTDLQISYRLDGANLPETTGNRTRLAPAVYTNLPIGAYDFIVTAVNSSGHIGQTASWRIIKGREFTVATYGTLVMHFISMLIMGCLLIYTFRFRKRHQLEDRLSFWMIMANILMAFGQLLTCLVENTRVSASRELMILGNTIFYIMLAVFPCLLVLYIHINVGQTKKPSLVCVLLYAVPCFLFTAFVLINLKTGWLFYVTEELVCQPGLSGVLSYLPQAPVMIYFLIFLIRTFKNCKRLFAVGIVLILTNLIWDIWTPGISSISFIYSLMIMSICIHAIHKSMKEVTA